jgi:hypothetical protein
MQGFGLINPVVPRRAPDETFQVRVNPSKLGRTPFGDLIVMKKAHLVEKLLQFWTDTFDQFQVIRTGFARGFHGARLFACVI